MGIVLEYPTIANGGSGGTVTASNGLTKTLDNIELGGTLTKDTVIDGDGKGFSVMNLIEFIVTLQNGQYLTFSEEYFELVIGINGIGVQPTNIYLLHDQEILFTSPIIKRDSLKPTANLTNLEFPSWQNVLEQFNQVQYVASLSSGLLSGGVLSIGTPTSTFSISDGSGLIVNHSTQTAFIVSWTGKTNIATTNIATSTVSYISIDKDLNVIQRTTIPTSLQSRNEIYLGQLGHSNLSTISTAVVQPHVAFSPISQMRDWLNSININDGNVITANGANLSINKSLGTITALGIGWNGTNAVSPNDKTFPAQILATIRRRTQTGGTGTNTTLDVLNYDLGGVVTAISGTKVQNQRVFLLSSGNIIVQYGQVLYNSLSEAIQGLSSETFVRFENTKDGTLIAIISVQNNCTSLQDTTRAKFLYPSRFGDVSSATSGISVSTLQQAYDNSITPEITTNATNGPFTVKRGSALDTDDVIDVLNGAGTRVFAVTGQGVIIGILSDNAVTTSKITDLNVTTAKIADNAVTQAKIGTNAVTNAKLATVVANTVKANATATTATPTDVVINQSEVLGRAATGNIKSLTRAEQRANMGILTGFTDVIVGDFVANTRRTFTLTVVGAGLGQGVYVRPNPDLQEQINLSGGPAQIYCQARVTAVDTITIDAVSNQSISTSANSRFTVLIIA